MKNGLLIALLALWSASLPVLAQDAATAKARAYELYQAKRFNEAAQQFKAYFDTNTTSHHHYFVEGQERLLDIAENEILLDNRPTPPEGYEIAGIDVIVRLHPKR